MATYTDNYSLTKPTFAEVADIRTINGNMDTIDDIMHASQVSLAEAYDQTATYNTGDVVMYEFLMYKCKEDNVTGNWDATKWERTTAAETGGEASDLSVKVPEVISTGDKACYVKRAIPTAGALAEGQKIVGATLAWNQLVDTLDGLNTQTQGTTVTRNTDGTYSVSGMGSGNHFCSAPDFEYGVNHKYLYRFTGGKNGIIYQIALIKTGQTTVYKVSFNATDIDTETSGIINCSESNLQYLRSRFYTTQDYSGNTTVNLQLFDLTALFGSTIADAIYQMEQTTAGSGVVFFRKYFPEDYYAYENGKLESVNVSAHKAYDSNAAEVSSITLDSSKEFRGLYKLVDGELRADGDVYEADGTVTRKYGIIDISTIPESSWSTSVQNNNRRFRTLLNFKTPPNNNTPFNAICNKYITTDANNPYLGNITDCVCGETLGYICIYDNAYTTVAQFLSASSGVYLVYELATPTTESATPYTNPQLVDADGTEEFVDYKVSQGTRDVAIPVGHESSFYDYTDGTITIPDLPFADGTYALSVTMNNGTPTFSWEGGN